MGYEADGISTRRAFGYPSRLAVVAGGETSPAVMLSPKARNVVRDSCGSGAATVTVNVHDLVVCTASVAVQRTVVAPTGKSEAAAGVQLVCTGAMPPALTGDEYETVMPLLLVAATDTLTGHEMLSPGVADGGVGGGVDEVGDVGDEQPNTTRVSVSSDRPRAWHIPVRWRGIGTNTKLYYQPGANS